jgi:hypothetical protein
MTDIMSAMDLAVYPQVGLVIFLGVFAVVLMRTLGARNRDELQRLASMALAPDDRPGSSGPGT